MTVIIINTKRLREFGENSNIPVFYTTADKELKYGK